MPLPYAWRVTKYNPALRNSQGHYPIDEWTSFSDIGKSFGGKVLTREDYLSRESAYVNAALSFLSEAGLESLRIVELENKNLARTKPNTLHGITLRPASLERNAVVQKGELADVIRLNLREVLWCKLGTKKQFYLHFGYDYYMYIGSSSPSLNAIRSVHRDGLYVEEMVSPYL